MDKYCLFVITLVMLQLSLPKGWGQPVSSNYEPASQIAQATSQSNRTQIQPITYQQRLRQPADRRAFVDATSLAADAKPNDRIWQTVSSLAVVAGLMLGFIWWSRKHQETSLVATPSDLVRVIGRVPLDAKHQAHLVRFGDRILLLSLDGSGVTKLGDIAAAEAPQPSDRLPQARNPAL